MRLHRKAREYLKLEIVTEPPVASWEASFDDGVTWVAGAKDGTLTRWLLAGPEAAGEGATVLTGNALPLLRAADNPEVIVTHGPRIQVY